jgi:hypothetical protein
VGKVRGARLLDEETLVAEEIPPQHTSQTVQAIVPALTARGHGTCAIKSPVSELV